MYRLKTLIYWLVLLNCLFMAVFFSYMRDMKKFGTSYHLQAHHKASKKLKNTQKKLQNVDGEVDSHLRRRNNVQNSLRWSNPFFLLGNYPKMDLKYFNSYPDGGPLYEKFNYGIINDPDYCEITDAYNIAHPENMFAKKNFLTDYAKNGLVRDNVIRKLGADVMPQITKYMEREDFKSASFHLNPTINNFFTTRNDLHIHHILGKNFNCATQMYNHIPGHGALKRRDLIADNAYNYAAKYEAEGKAQCFNKEMLIPYTYRLYNETECKAFFEKINSEEYQLKLKDGEIQFIMRPGYITQKANVSFLLDYLNTEQIIAEYQNGALCGSYNRSLVAQKYVSNPLPLDKDRQEGRVDTFTIRVYMLIASTNPLIVYYHDGFPKVTLGEYTHPILEGISLVEPLDHNLDKRVFEELAIIEAVKAERREEYETWTLWTLSKYLQDNGKINNTFWLSEELRPALMKAMVHLVRMSSHALWKESNVYEMFGLDFILDDKMNLWFIDCISSPELSANDKQQRRFLSQMLTDLFEIQYAYYKSRMKRAMRFFAKIAEETQGSNSINYREYKEEFKEAMKNKIHKEYRFSDDNGFKIVMNMNLEGEEAYKSNLQPECMNDEDSEKTDSLLDD